MIQCSLNGSQQQLTFLLFLGVLESRNVQKISQREETDEKSTRMPKKPFHFQFKFKLIRQQAISMTFPHCESQRHYKFFTLQIPIGRETDQLNPLNSSRIHPKATKAGNMLFHRYWTTSCWLIKKKLPHTLNLTWTNDKLSERNITSTTRKKEN